EFEVAVQPGVKGGARHGVVVVGKMFTAFEHDVVRRAEQGVNLLQFGKSFGGHFFGPVVRASHALRFGGEQGGELDVAGIDAEQAGVFASAAALHGGAQHHGGGSEGDARIDPGEDDGLAAAAAGA